MVGIKSQIKDYQINSVLNLESVLAGNIILIGPCESGFFFSFFFFNRRFILPRMQHQWLFISDRKWFTAYTKIII